MAMTPLAARALEAYGGPQLWGSARTMRCRLSAHGWAFRLKMRPALRGLAYEMDVAEPRVAMRPWDRHSNRAVFDGAADEVRIESPGGEVIAGRKNPRRYFPNGRRLFRWDDLDAAYFCAYAAWNYLTFPRLLMRSDIDWQQVSDSTLEARFPASVPTHSPVQQFHFDAETGLLRQHDYTAEVFGGWAKAANVVLEHASSGDARYASRRRVTPRSSKGTPRRLPLLVGIEVADLMLEA